MVSIVTDELLRMNQVVPPGFLFRWSFTASQVAELPHRSGRLLNLPESSRVPSFSELDSKRDFADVRLAWNANGIGVSLDVRGRSRKPMCSSSTARESDGINLWIDTRNTQGVHRATRFCHQFCVLPSGGGAKHLDPLALQFNLARAREESSPADLSLIKLQSEIQRDGYWLDAWLPKEVLVGFDPAVSAKLGFHYLVRDLELGVQTLAVGTEFPVEVDPSLWQTVELVEA
jgi:hypothetical protein